MRPSSPSRSLNASILVAIGVPRGRRLRGGNGCRLFFPGTAEGLGLASGVFMALPPERSESSPPLGLVSKSESRLELAKPLSNVWFALRGAGKFS